MKTIFCAAGSIYNPVSETVQLNSFEESDKLTPKMARSAARVAFGHSNGVTVSDGTNAYRLYKSSHRRIEADSE